MDTMVAARRWRRVAGAAAGLFFSVGTLSWTSGPASAATGSCAGLAATVVGTPGADVLTGTSGDDVIAGLGGNDDIDGGGGNDVLCGGDGDDRIAGQAGDDRIFGGAGADHLQGDIGNDRISGDGGNDTVLGGKGDDFINGDAGDDIVKGEQDNDIVRGGAGDDLLAGGTGDDALNGGTGTDTCDPNNDPATEGTNTYVNCESVGPVPQPTALVAEEALVEVLPLEVRLLDLEARLTSTTSGAPVPGQTIVMTVPTATPTVVCSALTDTNGVATCSGNLSESLSVVLNLGYTATFAGTPGLAPASDDGALVAL